MLIGVLTKADTVQEGDHAHWLKILNNEAHHLRRGYYMTRLPGPTSKESNQTWEDTRKIERSFFKKGPWSDARDKKRLGMDFLTEALSAALARMIEDMYSPFSTVLTVFQASQFKASTRC